MSDHDPAGCRQEPCQRCDDYGFGYSVGKSKALFEVKAWRPGAHAADCRCGHGLEPSNMAVVSPRPRGMSAPTQVTRPGATCAARRPRPGVSGGSRAAGNRDCGALAWARADESRSVVPQVGGRWYPSTARRLECIWTGGTVYMDETTCRMCDSAIPLDRRQRWSWAVTCSRPCSDANTAEAGRRARRAYRRRRGEQIRQGKA